MTGWRADDRSVAAETIFVNAELVASAPAWFYKYAALGFQLADSYGTYKAQKEYSPCNSSL